MFYNPNNVLKRGIYVLAVKEKDGDNDKGSNLDRQDIYRVNLGIRKKHLSNFLKKYQNVLKQAKGIWAKPIVDILIEVSDTHDMSNIKDILIKKGYTFMWQNEKRMSFNKGYTVDGFAEKVYHLHIRISGDNDELYFRDYLNEDFAVAKQLGDR